MTPVPPKHIEGKESNQRDLITSQVTIVNEKRYHLGNAFTFDHFVVDLRNGKYNNILTQMILMILDEREPATESSTSSPILTFLSASDSTSTGAVFVLVRKMDHIDNNFNSGNGDDHNVGNDDYVVVDDTDCVERDFETSRTAVEEIVPIQFTASHLAIIIVIINTNL